MRLLGSLPAGSRLEFGTIYNEPIVWDTVEINHPGYPADSYLLRTKYIIKIMCYDAKESANTYANYQSYGNSQYRFSNLRQWLNSDNAQSWFNATAKYDAPPVLDNVNATYKNDYATFPGFLSGFNEFERAYLLPITHYDFARNQVNDAEYIASTAYNANAVDVLTDKVLIPSLRELGLVSDFTNLNSIEVMGVAYAVGEKIKLATPTAVANSTAISGLAANTAWHYWTRDQINNATYYYAVYPVTNGGAKAAATAANAQCNAGHNGIVPACCLPLGLSVSDEPNERGNYYLLGNYPPVISGKDIGLDILTTQFEDQSYIISDLDFNAEVKVTEYVEFGDVLREYVATLGKENILSMTKEQWQKLTNGQQKVIIRADDGFNIVVRIFSFIKKENLIEMSFERPKESEDMPLRCSLKIEGVFPTGSELKVEVCNNGFDDEPTWEDRTIEARLGAVFNFTNREKQADAWGVNCRIIMDRRNTGGACCIESLRLEFK